MGRGEGEDAGVARGPIQVARRIPRAAPFGVRWTLIRSGWQACRCAR
jgi:hypothetical protein